MNKQEVQEHFWDLNEKKGEECIQNAVNEIINLTWLNSKMGPAEASDKSEIGQLFLSPPTPFPVYVLKRCLEGILSSGLEMRTGLTLLFNAFLEKFAPSLDFDKLLEFIETNSKIQKSEKPVKKQALISGQLALFTEISSYSSVTYSVVNKIIDTLFGLFDKYPESDALLLVKSIINSAGTDVYASFPTGKSVKLVDTICSLTEKRLANTAEITKMTPKDLSLILMLAPFSCLTSDNKTSAAYQIRGRSSQLVRQTFKTDLLSEKACHYLIGLLLKEKLQETSPLYFEFYCDYLKQLSLKEAISNGGSIHPSIFFAAFSILSARRIWSPLREK